MNNILKDIVSHGVLMIINEYMDNIKTSCNDCSKTKFDKFCIECNEFKCDDCDLFINRVCLKCCLKTNKILSSKNQNIYIKCCHNCHIVKNLLKHDDYYTCSNCEVKTVFYDACYNFLRINDTPFNTRYMR